MTSISLAISQLEFYLLFSFLLLLLFSITVDVIMTSYQYWAVLTLVIYDVNLASFFILGCYNPVICDVNLASSL